MKEEAKEVEWGWVQLWVEVRARANERKVGGVQEEEEEDVSCIYLLYTFSRVGKVGFLCGGRGQADGSLKGAWMKESYVKEQGTMGKKTGAPYRLYSQRGDPFLSVVEYDGIGGGELGRNGGGSF